MTFRASFDAEEIGTHPFSYMLAWLPTDGIIAMAATASRIVTCAVMMPSTFIFDGEHVLQLHLIIIWGLLPWVMRHSACLLDAGSILATLLSRFMSTIASWLDAWVKST